MLIAFTSLPGFMTNLAALTPRHVVSMYQKRWAIELMHWELKSGLGLGEHQVSGSKDRSEKSVGIAVPQKLTPGSPFGRSASQSTRRD